MEDARGAFLSWWNDGGDKSRARQFDDAARVASEPIANTQGIYDVDTMESLLDVHLQHHGRLIEWRPAAEDFLQQAMAISTAVLIEKGADDDSPRLGWNETKALMAGECHGFQRVVSSLDRLSSTINLRVDSLRTMISAEKMRWEKEMGSGPKRRS